MAEETNPRRSEASKKPRLGRGLSSRIVNSAEAADESAYRRVTGLPPVGKVPRDTAGGSPAAEKLRDVPLEQIGPNPHQPRQDFEPQQLAALAESISKQGLLQPLIVAESSQPAAAHRYLLVAGERRLRAARQLNLPSVPCLVRQATPRQMLEWALIENIHRTDLNPIERAEAYRNYVDRFALTQDQAAEKLGQPRSTVANYLRLLDLCDDVRQMVIDGRLSFGHAKVLAGLVNQPARQLALARKAAARQLSVRRLEGLVSVAEAAAGAPSIKARAAKPAYIRDLEAQLSQALGTRVTIQPGRAKQTGRVVIEYYSLDDFDRIAAALGAKLEG
ncbi:MAG: ParB/RepB/Spo0J family partition protein [Planctomycetota bacterium]|jgi:ParB family chromosome partitioning protein